MVVTSETHQLPVRKLVAASAGNAVEWYDWGIYTAFSIYFAGVFFPEGDATAQLLNTAGIFAVGFLLLDAVLLIWGGMVLNAPIAVVVGGLFAGIAIALVFWWRRYRRLEREVEQYRREMKREVEGIRDLLKKANLNN